MPRILPLVFLIAGCAAAKPVVARSRPNGPAVVSDADHRWGTYIAAHTDAMQIALAQANAMTPNAPTTRLAQVPPAITNQSTPYWLPDEERFEIRYTYTLTVTQHWSTTTGSCGKYRFRSEMESQPSPRPCPPPIPTYFSREYAATMGLVLEYDANGSFLAEHPTLPAPVPPKPAAPKG